MRARLEFRDGRSVDDAIEQIASEKVEDAKEGEAAWHLKPSFPTIEVIRWRCKLRDEETGRPLVDPKSGGELYDSSEHLFTLDNRRLYCIQKAAVKHWPQRTTVEILELPASSTHARVRELKKFRTLDRGKGVFMGGRGEGETMARWSWREEVGIKDESEAEAHVYMRRKPRREHPLAGRQAAAAVAAEGSFLGISGPYAGMALFLAIYVLLRIGGSAFAAVQRSWSKGEAAPDLQTALGLSDWRGAVVMLVRVALVVVLLIYLASSRGKQKAG
jgi:hypothetical protein